MQPFKYIEVEPLSGYTPPHAETGTLRPAQVLGADTLHQYALLQAGNTYRAGRSGRAIGDK